MVIVRRPQPRRVIGRRIAAVLLGLLTLGLIFITGQWRETSVSRDNRQASQERTSQNNISTYMASETDTAQGELVEEQPQPAATAAVQQRCRGTLGDWCVRYYTQREIPAVTAPRGDKTCSMDCNKVGTCNALSGQCSCPAGWHTFNCLLPMKRHCANAHRQWGFDPPRWQANLSMGVGWESIWGFPRSHCAGYCDSDIAACFCPTNTTYGRIPAAVDAPQGSGPQRVGRPMGTFCQPNRTDDGRATAWGTVNPEDLFGPQGWCNAEKPSINCDCYLDGLGGPTCEEPYEQFCFNQCNGRGECNLGFCKCDPGWHGIDCAHRSTTADLSQPGRDAQRPWIAPFIHTPAAQEFPAGATRRRPLIFAYELPSDYHVLMLQYRLIPGEFCTPRFFRPGNTSDLSRWTYALEQGFLEMLLQSGHRTLDPEEADFFYVPVFTSCFIHPVRDAADSLRDFYYSVAHNRVQGAANMMLEAYHWIRAVYPYWDRHGGRDHIWLVTHDEASCWVPADIRRHSIILSHWGRKDANHTSGTGYGADNYSADMAHPQFEPDGFLAKLDPSLPCYNPRKDLVVPLMKTPDHYHLSPLLGAPPRPRTWLAFHRGRVQMDNPPYSRGIRQRLAKAAQEGGWLDKYKIAVGEHDNIPGDYSELLSSSLFCLVLPGDGWSARMDDATLHGCIPVIIMDEVEVSFESAVDLSAFTLRIAEKDAEQLPEILQAVTHQQREAMQLALARVWQRFTYSSYRPYAQRFRELQQRNTQQQQQQQSHGDGGSQETATPASLPAAATDVDPESDDAFGTIMAWLLSRIDDTH